MREEPELNPSTTGRSLDSLAVPVRLPFERILPGPIADYVLLTFGGTWGHEYLIHTTQLPTSGFHYQEQAGRSCAHLRPYWMLYNRTSGQGLAIALACMGNWLFELKPEGGTTLLRVRTSPDGIVPFDTLNGLPVPGALVSAFEGHWDYGAQPIVRFIRQRLLRNLGPDWPLVQYNNWYGYEGTFDEKSLMDSARAAHDIGCELFTLDAGWYGKGDWSATVGDWTVNNQRFPNGLEAVSKVVHQLGMKFGLWIEIECAAPDTPVGRAHPDWYLSQGAHRLSDRAVLDFGKPEMLAYARSVIDRLVKDYGLDYIKMDFNTDTSLDGEKEAAGSDPIYRHLEGLTKLWSYMRTKYPALIVENCSSGSLRQDVMPAAYTDTHWVSDNVDNRWNLAQNYGATLAFPPEMCSHWTVTPTRDDSALDLEAQFTANMLGHLGLSGHISRWDAATLRIAAEKIALYKQIRPIIRKADVYHLTPPISPSAPRSMQVLLYVDSASNSAVLFVFHGGAPEMEHTVKLRGLQGDEKYRVNMPPGFGPTEIRSGKELMEQGLSLKFPHSGASAVILLEVLKKAQRR